MATYDVRPGSDIATTSWSSTPLWSKLDDPWGSPDDATSEIQTTSEDTPFRLGTLDSDIAGLNDDLEKILSVAVKYRWIPGGGFAQFTARGGLRLDGTNHFGSNSNKSGGAPFVDVTKTWSLHPGTSAEFVKADIEGAEFISEVSQLQADLPRPKWTQIIARVTTEERSKLEQICRTLMTKILTLSDITSSKTGFKVKGWQTLRRPPAVFIAPAGETKGRGPTRSKENQVVVTLPTVVKGKDPLVEFFDLYKRIEEVIESDPSLGGLALDTYISGFTGLVTDEEIANDLHVSDIFVTVDYRHDRGSP